MLNWVIFIAVVIVVAQGVFLGKRSLNKVQYSRYFSTGACTEGDTVYMVERLANRGLVPLPWIRLESSIHADLKFERRSDLDVNEGNRLQNHKSLFSLMPYTEVVRRHRIQCRKRGCYDLDSVTMTGGDMLGVAKSTQICKVNARLLVYPKPAPPADTALPSHSWQGDVLVKRWIVDDPFVLAGVREYRSGDAWNRINWKATARSGKLQVHNTDFTSDHKLMIVLNVEISDKMWKEVTEPERIERGIRHAAALAEQAINSGMEVGFGCNGRLIDDAARTPVRVRPRGGKSHLALLNETMAKLVIERTVPFELYVEEDVLRKERNMDYVIITSFVSANIERQLRLLTNAGNAVKVIALPPEPKEGGTAEHAHRTASGMGMVQGSR